MIGWSIEAAAASGLFDRIIVSTDDAEIAAVAKSCGAEVPFLRPGELSGDYAGITEVVAHAVQWAFDQGAEMDAVCCIFATAPFVRAEDIRRGLEALDSGGWAYAFTATDFAAPIFRAFKQSAEGGVEMFMPEYFTARSQDLPVALHDAAQFYWGRPAAWLEGKRIFERHSKPLIIPRWRVQDIDSLDDWARAEMLAPAIMRRKD
jgi:N-acylneuraminate cytidylyltransferase